ncbi:hypothetical protein [Piscinibacter sakaiensis]|uniref:DNA polymerase III, delta prime subunit n=1 Tax=Piscinibacter sakaiensis TaxID=1547922 RepID=A0A0K8NWG0_PISS1|nr:hypothetical protein [Piscinibacter sakaiensis]GAP34708.1 DNA polymerase III, delta prime subunit [Piscinibacter sakaiensis]
MERRAAPATAAGPLPAEDLPWLAAPLQLALQRQRGHALLVTGPADAGPFAFGLALARAWLCEAPPAPDGEPLAPARPACGHCAGCRLGAAGTHPDLRLLLPDALREAWGWAAEEGGEARASKAKPSREIKVDAVRAAVAFAQSTASRGRSKVVLVHPAEDMNGIAANALLKTLEEPPGAARFILCSAAPAALLPTIRSRCQAVPLAPPPPDQALAWLAGQGIAQPEVLLAAAGGQPLRALQRAHDGLQAAAWTQLPRELAAGRPGVLAGWALPQVVEALQMLCHDLMCRAAGASPRYFPAEALARLPAGGGAAALARHGAWLRELQRLARHAGHPFSPALAVEALVARAREALN